MFGRFRSDLKFEVMAGSIFQKRFSISPALDIRFLRVVLDWGAEPLDLDAHFVKDGAYHISYRNMKSLADESAALDRDARNGYGPETITVKEISKNASY
jgi:adhesin/invasin